MLRWPDRAFEVGASTLVPYGLVALALSLTLLLQSRLRGTEELLLWTAAYVGIGLFSLWRPAWAPLAAGAAAFLLGIVKTHCAGPNLDLGLSLIALSVAVFVLDGERRSGPQRSTSLDPAGLALLLVAVWSLVSLAFAVARIRGFTPAPGFDYHVYPFNPLHLTSDEAVIRATTGATAMFVWFGLYQYARSVGISRHVLRGVVTGLLAVNAAVLVVQQHVDPFFLLHAGRPVGRLNGVTSYCWSLGDAALALFLLLPLWGAWRGAGGLLTLANLTLILYAVGASGSRTALLVMLLAATLWVAHQIVRLQGRRRFLVAVACLVGALAGVVGLALAYRATEANNVTLLGRFKYGAERDGVLGHVFVTRLSSYPLIARVVATYPLSGVGAGLYSAEVSKQHALLAPDLEMDPFLEGSFAPNQFLNVAVELGAPALVALALVFAWVGWSAASQSRDPRFADVGIGVLALFVALQTGPSFYTSEALVFFWLLVGRGAWRAEPIPPGASVGDVSTGSLPLVAAAAALGLAGQLLALPSLRVDTQWHELRWPMNMGLLRRDDGGRWTRPEATFTVDTAEPHLRFRWHVGDPEAPDYRARVSFFVDGVLRQRSIVGPGPIRGSVLPLPADPGLKRISVQVEPPFVPDQDVPLRLGVYLHRPLSGGR